MTTRSFVLSTFVQRHQVRQYLRMRGVERSVDESLPGDDVEFTVDVPDEKWADILAWVEKVKA